MTCKPLPLQCSVLVHFLAAHSLCTVTQSAPWSFDIFKTGSDSACRDNNLACMQSILEMAGQQHILGSLEENDPEADEELMEQDDEGRDEDAIEQDDEAADDLADALAKQAQIQ